MEIYRNVCLEMEMTLFNFVWNIELEHSEEYCQHSFVSVLVDKVMATWHHFQAFREVWNIKQEAVCIACMYMSMQYLKYDGESTLTWLWHWYLYSSTAVLKQ